MQMMLLGVWEIAGTIEPAIAMKTAQEIEMATAAVGAPLRTKMTKKKKMMVVVVATTTMMMTPQSGNAVILRQLDEGY